VRPRGQNVLLLLLGFLVVPVVVAAQVSKASGCVLVVSVIIAYVTRLKVGYQSSPRANGRYKLILFLFIINRHL
jgi:hypothetical protein